LITIIDENEAVAEKLSDISAEELKKALQTKEFDNKSLNKKPESKSSKPSEIREIDLHIHELLDQHEGMNPQEILDYQMDCFRKEMQKAIADRVKKIVFIHGKGNGSLKSELRRELKHKYRKHQFQDASFQQYGFGATMVYIH
jgi:dsDNA-specific endonuclease/ATPase MutS2